MYTNPMHPQGPQGQYGQGHQGNQGHHVLYQADGNYQHMMRQKRDTLMHAIHPHMGHKVRITTIDGHTHEGVLINSDGHHVYLHVDTHHGHNQGHHQGQHRPIYTPAQYNQIITLVLFELLVILLLA
ncbi:hypothetical protein [Paenibacillus pectinilyticus]|uniref:hypothetical protein n=1 Tax=Paenibacillus pectinilyticus TaxID=512399 RepID=UPI000A05580C|nr:hypothetical protein [Paenibacillus pectinilyticus]